MFVLGLGPAEHGERLWAFRGVLGVLGVVVCSRVCSCVFRGVLGVLGVVVCSRVSGACWVVAVMRKVVVDSANNYLRRRSPRIIIRAVGLREILFAE